MRANTFDVVVVGAGIVGTACALALLKQGLSVALIDHQELKSPQTRDVPLIRVSAINEASKQFLNNLGVWAKLPQERVTSILGMEISSLDSVRRRSCFAGRPQNDVQRGSSAASCFARRPEDLFCEREAMHSNETSSPSSLRFDAAEFGYADLGHIVENDFLGAALLDQFKQAGGYFFCPVRVLEVIDQGPWTLKTTTETIEASYLVIAQGARSDLRERLGVSKTIEFYDQKALVLNIETEKPHRFTAYQRFLSTGPLAFLPLFQPHWMSIVWTLPTAVADDYLRLDSNVFLEKLQNAFEGLGEIKALSSVFAFELSALSCERYAGDHFILMGDSAHTVHPLAGQGLNMGLWDVAELMQQISKEGRLSQKVLDHYNSNCKLRNQFLSKSFGFLNTLFQLEHPLFQRILSLGLRGLEKRHMLKQRLVQVARGEGWIF